MSKDVPKVGEAFRNPYSFVPFRQRPAQGPLADAEPSGHARYEDDHMSGSLTFSMDVRTPLLVPDRWDQDASEHRSFGVLTTDGAPVIHGASIKGALRSAFELVTGSRVPVAHQWKSPVARRLEAASAIELIPVRIVAAADGEGLEAELLLGDIGSAISSSGLKSSVKKGARLPAALLPAYGHWTRLIDLGDKPAKGPQKVEERRARIQQWHGREVRVELKALTHSSKRFNLWGVERVLTTDPPLPARPDGASPFANYPEQKGVKRLEVTGYLALTGLNAQRKHYERVFFSTETNPVRLPVSESVLAGWRSVMRAYRDAHTANDLRSTKALGRMADDWSAHLIEEGRDELRAGSLCYAVVDEAGAGGELRIVALQPVTISRRPYASTPWELAPADVRPARRLAEASPADRVFGWVPDGTSDRSQKDAAGFRGLLRVANVTGPAPDSVKELDPPLPLAILASPKPSSPRFYFSDPAGSPMARRPKSQIDLAAGTAGLRGRKVYPPHDPAVPADPHGAPSGAARPGGVKDSQNSTVQAWIEPGSRISVRLEFTQMSRAELGALLQTIELCSGQGRLRLGTGKPLGFGSLEVDARSVDLRVASGIEIRDAYRSGRVPSPGSAGPAQVAALLSEFRAVWNEAFAESTDAPWTEDTPPRALARAFGGWQDGLETSYPTAIEGATRQIAPGYTWFVMNESPNNPASQQPLPSIDAEDSTLKVLPDRFERQGDARAGTQGRSSGGRTGGGDRKGRR
jgi:CRISPR-associated protein (TIGR03986 family)